MPDRKVTLREASVLLGVSEGAIRKRVARGTIRSEMGDDGLRYVWVDMGADGGEDASHTAGEGVRDEMVEDLRDQVAYLRSQLDVRADERDSAPRHHHQPAHSGHVEPHRPAA